MSEAAPYCTQIAGVKKGCSSRDRTSEVKECSSRDRASEVKECSSRDRTTGVKKEYSESGQAGYSDCHIICSFQIMWRLLLLSLCLGFRSCGVCCHCHCVWVSDHVVSGCYCHCVWVSDHVASVVTVTVFGFQIMWRLLSLSLCLGFRSCGVWLLLSLCLGFRSCGFWLLLSRCCGFQVMWRLVINVTVLWLSDHVASGCYCYCVVGFRSCGFWLLLSLCCGFQISCGFLIMWRLVVTVTMLWVSDHVVSGCHAYCVVAFRSCSVWLSRLLCCGFQIMWRLVVTLTLLACCRADREQFNSFKLQYDKFYSAAENEYR